MRKNVQFMTKVENRPSRKAALEAVASHHQWISLRCSLGVVQDEAEKRSKFDNIYPLDLDVSLSSYGAKYGHYAF